MSEQITPLALVKAQRDQLAANLHDLHVSHQMTLAALAETNARLAAAEARIAELERPVSNREFSTRLWSPNEAIKPHQERAAGTVKIASEDDADSAA